MAEAGVTAPRNSVAVKDTGGLRQRLEALSGTSKLGLMMVAAATIALLVGVFLWSSEPAWRILFTNVPDKDGGAIIQSLQQMNIPYKLEAGGTIQVPAANVYDARLRLAGEGLPKAGNVGFELMDTQKFGISQFAEQVNYQRAIEGELARSIQTISVVESARVHLAIPKQTVFLRDQQKPSASIVLTLQRSRQLDNGQVAGIVHLVSSSVPDLPVKNVTLVDQDGNLLSRGRDNQRTNLDPTQIQYVQQVERNFVERIEAILAPIVGPGNVRAEVTAQVDFSEVEETSEKFRPNSPPSAASIRSLQTSELTGRSGNDAAAGVPGALSNQPPGAATAPVTATTPADAPTTAAGAAAVSNSRREATTNYEVDKTIQHIKQSVGGVKRLSVAVVVNYKSATNDEGASVPTALPEAQMTQITNLVRDAIGYDQERGDSVNVVNAAFAQPAPKEEQAMPDQLLSYVKLNMTDVVKVALIVIVVFYLLFFVVRPLMRDMRQAREEPRFSTLEDGSMATSEAATPQEVARAAASEETKDRMSVFADLLQQAKDQAKNDPRMVATILREWMSGSDESLDPNKKS